jgi:hypothetical protein
MDWILKACDLNKDVGIDDTCQLTLPDIRIKHADRVFRVYVKSLHDKAVYRSEESLTLNQMLPEALESIRYTLKYDKEAYIKILKQEARKRQQMMRQIIETRHLGSSVKG